MRGIIAMVKLTLKEFLDEKGWTMYQLQKEASIRPATIHQWCHWEEYIEKDKPLKSLSIDVLNKICKTLNCDISDIVKYVDDEE